jgi:hypothetical protein
MLKRSSKDGHPRSLPPGSDWGQGRSCRFEDWQEAHLLLEQQIALQAGACALLHNGVWVFDLLPEDRF